MRLNKRLYNIRNGLFTGSPGQAKIYYLLAFAFKIFKFMLLLANTNLEILRFLINYHICAYGFPRFSSNVKSYFLRKLNLTERYIFIYHDVLYLFPHQK